METEGVNEGAKGWRVKEGDSEGRREERGKCRGRGTRRESDTDTQHCGGQILLTFGRIVYRV